MTRTIDIIEADLNDATHQQAVVDLLDEYIREPIIHGKPLPDEVRNRLVPALRKQTHGFTLLAFVDDDPAGLAVCFLGFSTFAAKPLMNIHDLAVAKRHRRTGVGQKLLAAVEQKARRLGCCKLTLEVSEQNHPARALYRSVGFVSGADAATRFEWKTLSEEGT